MVSFKEYYFLCEVKASSKNIDQFRDEYRIEFTDERVKEIFNKFENQVKRGNVLRHPTDQKFAKDIFNYPSWDDLNFAIQQAEGSLTERQLDQAKKQGGIRVFQNDKVLVVHPTTHEACTKYGAGPQWCIAMKDDPSHFNSYVNEQGVAFLIFLPRPGFKIPTEKQYPQVKISEYEVDRAILEYPESFLWGTNPSALAKNVSQAIIGSYYHNEPIVQGIEGDQYIEILNHIARGYRYDGNSPDHALLVNQTRVNMERVMKNWNMNGTHIANDWLDHGEGGGEGAPTPEDAREMKGALQDQGFWGLIELGWHITGDRGPAHQSAFGMQRQRYDTDMEGVLKPIMDRLFQGSASIGRPNPVPVAHNRWQKAAIAIYTLGGESEDMAMHGAAGLGQLDDEPLPDDELAIAGASQFGPYIAEGWDGNNEVIDIEQILQAFDVTREDVGMMSQYMSQFSMNKLWEDGNPNNIFTYMETPTNQTPENIERADQFFIDRPFERSTWSYAREIRHREWPELEDKFIAMLDEAVGEEVRVKGLKKKMKEWDGVQEVQRDLDIERMKGVGGGTGVGAPEATDWVNREYRSWIEQHEIPIGSFLNNATGLLGYLFHVKKYNWPELEKRILDPKYYHIRLTALGPSWIQHGRGGKRWKEFEDVLEGMWDYTTSNPFTNQKDVNAATGVQIAPGKHATPWEREGAKLNIADHNQFYGDVENVIDLVKHTKRALGGGTGGSEEAAWHSAKDAWWNDPEVVKLYWGHGAIEKKQKPSEKKRSKKPTKYFVKEDGYTKRPFYHMVTPGAWLEAIPDPFQIDQLRDGIKYVGFAVGKLGWTYDK
jgi:hypothetical protein